MPVPIRVYADGHHSTIAVISGTPEVHDSLSWKMGAVYRIEVQQYPERLEGLIEEARKDQKLRKVLEQILTTAFNAGRSFGVANHTANRYN